MDPMTRRSILAWLGSAAVAGASGCLSEGSLKRAVNLTPRSRGDGWRLATPERVDLSAKRIRNVYDRVFSEHEFLNALSLLVVRRGYLVAEGYTRSDSDATRKGHVQSVTKSLTSLAFGIQRSQGHFEDLDRSLADILTVNDREKRAITLRHLLTMRSGIDVDNERFAEQIVMRQQRDVTQWLLDQRLSSDPGKRFDYRDCDPQLLGAALLAETGESVEIIVRRDVFEPLGITDYHWEHTADDEPLTAHGLWLGPRDLAKIGELVRRQGNWRGTPIVPAEWIELATQQQSTVPEEEATRGLVYGYYFWVDPELGWASAWGHGGNFVLVAPDEELVMVMTSMPDAGEQMGTELPDFVELARQLVGR